MIVIPARVKIKVAMASALALAAGLLMLALLSKPAQAQAETTTTSDANGERHTTFHFNIQGRGKSESGAKYIFNNVFTLHENFPAGDPNYNVTYTQTVKLIRQGSATPTDDMEAKLLIHQTLNSQGELTSEILKAESQCT